MAFRQLGKLSPQVLTMTGSTNLVSRLSRASLHIQSNALYADSHRPSKKPLTAREIEQLSGQLPHFIFLLVRWWYKIRPLKVELADLRRRLQRNKEGFETKLHSQTRYFVRFPFLTDEEFSNWVVTTDSSSNEGYSWAEFVRSNRSAPGCAKALGMNESVYPDETNSKTQTISSFDDINKDHSFGYTNPVVYPKLSFRPASKQATSDAVVTTSTDTLFKGYGHFRGFISTRVPKRGDLVRAGFASLTSPESRLFGFVLPYGLQAYSHMVIRYRGDGRNYQIVVLPRPKWDFDQFSGHQFTLYTRGGPYWQIAKIPLSKFYRTYTGFVHTRQSPINTLNMRLMSFTLMDNIEGPFSLELDYIGFYYDNEQSDEFDYEKYSKSGMMQ